MKKFIVLVFVVALFATSCISQHIHIVGNGPQTGIKVERKQWYALWGLVPVGFVDTKELAGDAKDYEIYTRQNAGVNGKKNIQFKINIDSATCILYTIFEANNGYYFILNYTFPISYLEDSLIRIANSLNSVNFKL